MSDLLGSIFGSGERTSQTTRPDWMAQAMNRLRLNEATSLFENAGGLAQFGFPGGDAYTPSDDVMSMLSWARGNQGEADPSNYLSFADYLAHGDRTLRDDRTRAGETLDEALMRATGMSREAFDRAMGNTRGAYDTARLGNEEVFQRGMKEATDTTSNYISKVATPEILQMMALQGLEGGTAVGDAIARATAEAGLPLMETLLSGYQGNQGALGQGYLGATAGLSESDMAIMSALGQADIGARAGLESQYMANMANFVGSLPGASDALAMLPEKANLARAQAASTLFPMADYARGLKESDLLRRQGVFQSIYSGIPFTPGGTSSGRTSSQPLFNFFGQG